MMPLIKQAQPKSHELYNVAKDIAQENDLADAHPDRLAEMAKQMGVIWQEVQAEGPDWRNE